MKNTNGKLSYLFITNQQLKKFIWANQVDEVLAFPSSPPSPSSEGRSSLSLSQQTTFLTEQYCSPPCYERIQQKIAGGTTVISDHLSRNAHCLS